MAAFPMHHLHLPALPWDEIRSPSGKFHSFFRNISLGLGGIRNTGTWGGGHPFDLQVRRIPPGSSVCPYHLHWAQWELFVVLTGAGTVRTPDGVTPARTGDVFFHPPGTPHQLTATGSEPLEVLIVTDNPQFDGCYYPDSDKWALRPPAKIFRINEVHYFDGEDELPVDAKPYQMAPAPAAPPVAPFTQRKLNPADLPWDTWTSPRGKFNGISKEVSIALGAKRNTPTGLGGHPFDLELNKLAPRACGCPFHSHAAQWELYYLLRGTATVRANNETHTFKAGDVILHPPGEAHQIANASDTEELEFWLIADNPPVEYWHYPDSKKWGLRNPRLFFRPAEADYWDGEE